MSKKDKRAAKKAEVLKDDKKMSLSSKIILICGALVIACIILLFIQKDNDDSDVAVKKSFVENQGSVVTFPVSHFDDGNARYFQHKDDDLVIRFFILKSSDGVIRAAFDACDVCWRANKGYHQDGDDMVCRNCGRRFASVLVNEVQGGCNPAPLKRRIDGEKVVLNIEDILEGKRFFNFSGGS